MEGTHKRNRSEDFDFNSNAVRALFGGAQLFCAKVNLQVSITERYQQRIVRDFPALFLEGVSHRVVKAISSHGSIIRSALVGSISDGALGCSREMGLKERLEGEIRAFQRSGEGESGRKVWNLWFFSHSPCLPLTHSSCVRRTSGVVPIEGCTRCVAPRVPVQSQPLRTGRGCPGRPQESP